MQPDPSDRGPFSAAFCAALGAGGPGAKVRPAACQRHHGDAADGCLRLFLKRAQNRGGLARLLDRPTTLSRDFPHGRSFPSSRTSCSARTGRTRSDPSCSPNCLAKSRSRPSSACRTRNHNPRLRAAILAAKAQSMSKDVIERAIKRPRAATPRITREVRYEGYGPGGVALIVEALTDNPQPHRLGRARRLFRICRRHGRDRLGLLRHVQPASVRSSMPLRRAMPMPSAGKPPSRGRGGRSHFGRRGP